MNKKLIVGLTVLATPFVVENLVETNVASASQTATVQTPTVTKSSEYVLNKPAKAYVTANDAAKRVNQKATYQAGSYYVYNQNKGMVNISKSTGKAGAWINPVDNPNAKVATTSASTAKPTSQTAQTTSTTPAKPSTATSTSTNKQTQTVGNKTSAGLYAVTSPTEAYVNAADASRKVNAKGKVSVGNYHIFREYKGMVNISKAKGRAGSWINPGGVTTTTTTATAPVNTTKTTSQTTTLTKPTPSTSTSKTQQTVGNKTSAGLFAVTSPTEAYVNAADASRKANARGRVSVGNYHIFREYKGMLNISKAKGKAGSWINPGAVATTPTEPTKPTQTTPTKPATETTNNTGLYKLTKSTASYINAADASKQVNARGTVVAGDYHIFREYNGMLNISKAKGKVGSWINPNGKVTVNTPTQTVTKATPQNVKSPTYINGILLVNKKHPLPQNYNPGENKEAKTNFDKLRADLRKAGHGVSTSYSGFRSYNHQANLYRNYVARNGQATADTFSARPGYSEHQTGLAFDLIDLNGAALGGQGTTSASRRAADWVAKNAHNYGFIVRYKENIKNITGYMSEPWHLRYVGKTVASEIFRRNVSLETYLGAPGGDYIK